MIVQFVAGFQWEAVNASGVAQQVKLQGAIIATTLGDAAQIFSGDDNSCFTAELDDFLDGVGAPRAKASDYNISRLTTAFRHRFRNPALRRLVMPVERAFFPQIDVSDQEDGDIDEHLHEAVDSKTV